MREKITALHILLLLGFICQGFSWENYWMPTLYALVWFVCVKFSRGRRVVSEVFEIMIFGIGLIISVASSKGNPFTCSLYIGNVLLVFQAIRLLGPPMILRTKLMAAAIALTHLAIGSMVLLDYSFIIILGLSIVLIPKVFYDIDHDRYAQDRKAVFALVYGKKAIACIGLTMILFFLFFPRQRVIGPAGSGLMIRRRIMNSQMETSGSTGEGSDEILFQIQGQDISYLKLYSLEEFDGNLWKSSFVTKKFKRQYTDYDQEKDLYRQVTTKDSRIFNKVLPTDGYVKYLRGNFFHKSYISMQDNIIVSFTWNNNNPTYEYWVDAGSPDPLPLKAWEKKHYLQLPEQSEKVVDYVKRVVGPTTDPLKIAKKLESNLKNDFRYELGVPNLNRLNPIEDFLINQRRGHCERFASALAVMLRLQKIPSRVVVGYYPTQKNQFADFYNVRVKDGHAWTEAYIKNRGWVILDGTPYVETASQEESSFMLSVYDWVEFFWYTKVVNYSYSDQNLFLSSVVGFFRALFSFAVVNMKLLATILGIVITVVLLSKFKHFSFLGKEQETSGTDEKARVRQLEEIRHFYGQMLKILEKHQLIRSGSSTPFEFLEELEPKALPQFSDIQFITNQFCMVKYGNRQLTEATRREITEKIKSLRKAEF